MSSKIKRLVKNEYIYSILTKFIMVAISLVESVLLARYLGASLKGISAYISSITSVGATVITFGMHQAYPYLRKQHGKKEIYADYLSAVIALFLAYTFVAVVLSFLVNDIEVKIAILLIPVMGYANVVNYVCLVETPNRKNTIETGITLFYIVMLGLLAIFTKSNLFYAVIILAFASTLKAVVFTVMLHPHLHIHTGLNGMIVTLYKVGFFPMLALLMTTLNYQIDVLMLKQYPIITAAQIGIYSIGISVSNKIVLIPDTLKGVMVSKLAKGAKEDEVARVLRLCLWTGILLTIVFLLLGRWTIKVLYGQEYYGSYEVMAISAIGAVMIGYFKLIAQYNIVNGKQKYTVILLCISIMLNILMNVLLIPKYGINGAAIATCVSHIVCGIVFSTWFTLVGKVDYRTLFLPQRNDFESLFNMLKR